ncbi:rCG22847 [Rattus norvegicus]|uniref:RCG22847 n=1 Tax=Rattus norvegicus TaxID=10116 RepID=A6KPC3_RAT|nr:rCG22847 [Rattus norvegicus]
MKKGTSSWSSLTESEHQCKFSTSFPVVHGLSVLLVCYMYLIYPCCLFLTKGFTLYVLNIIGSKVWRKK